MSYYDDIPDEDVQNVVYEDILEDNFGEIEISTQSIFDSESMKDVDLNERNGNIMEIEIEYNESKSIQIKDKIINLNTKPISYLSKNDPCFNVRVIENFNESNCFICELSLIVHNIEKKDKTKKFGQSPYIINKYPTIDPDVFNIFSTLVAKCKNDYVETKTALIYYITKIQLHSNKNLKKCKNLEKIPFPDLSQTEIYLHANENRDIKSKVEEMAHTFADMGNFIKNNIGIIKQNHITNEKYIDNDALNSYKLCYEQASKILLSNKKINKFVKK